MVQVQSTWFPLYTGTRRNLCRTFLRRKKSDFRRPRRGFTARSNFRRAVEISVLPEHRYQPGAVIRCGLA